MPDQPRWTVEFYTDAQGRSPVPEFVESLPAGRHLLFTHGGVIRVLARDLPLDRFVATGTVVALDWRRQELVFLHEPGPVTS